MGNNAIRNDDVEVHSDNVRAQDDLWNKKTHKNQHTIYFDVLTILAAIAVVSMHVNSQYWQFRDAPSWWLNVFIEKTSYWAVPVFYMISGATLLNYRDRYSTTVYIQKRIIRTVIPFLCWSVVGIAYGMFRSGSVPIGKGIAFYINMIINTSIPEVNVYWFFIPLFAIYLSIPALSLFERSKRIKAFCWIVVYFFVGYILGKLLPVFSLEMNPAFYNPLCQGWVVYPILGYVLANINFEKKHRIVIYVAGFVGWMTMVGATVHCSYQTGELRHALSDGTGLPVAMLACAVFVGVRAFVQNEYSFFVKMSKVVGGGASLCFGVYLIHKFVLVELLRLTGIDPNRWWWPLVGIPIVVGISFCLAALLKTLPFIKKVV